MRATVHTVNHKPHNAAIVVCFIGYLIQFSVVRVSTNHSCVSQTCLPEVWSVETRTRGNTNHRDVLDVRTLSFAKKRAVAPSSACGNQSQSRKLIKPGVGGTGPIVEQNKPETDRQKTRPATERPGTGETEKAGLPGKTIAKRGCSGPARSFPYSVDPAGLSAFWLSNTAHRNEAGAYPDFRRGRGQCMLC